MITVYYDGACPKCVKDRHHYEKLSCKGGMPPLKGENLEYIHNQIKATG